MQIQKKTHIPYEVQVTKMLWSMKRWVPTWSNIWPKSFLKSWKISKIQMFFSKFWSIFENSQQVFLPCKFSQNWNISSRSRYLSSQEIKFGCTPLVFKLGEFLFYQYLKVHSKVSYRSNFVKNGIYHLEVGIYHLVK